MESWFRRVALLIAYILLITMTAPWGCDREPGIVVQLSTWPEGAERIRVRTTIDNIAGKEFFLAKHQTRFAVRVPAGSQGDVQLDAVGLDLVDCKLVSGSLTEPVPGPLSRFVERTLELSPLPAAPVCIFETKKDYFVGPGAYSLAVGDFDGDTNDDLAVVINSLNGIRLLMNNGAGVFHLVPQEMIAPFPAGTGPCSVGVSDFNSDMKPDLAVANFGSSDVRWLLSNGPASFIAGGNLIVGVAPYSLAVGDFNGDTKPDLAVANKNTNNVSVLLGDGAGGFAAAKDVPVGTGPVSVAVGDFNIDNKSDLAVATGNGVSVLMGNGLGDFDDVKSVPLGTKPVSVVVGDFNSDKKPDLGLASSTSSDVSVLLGNGAGGFRLTSFPVGTPSSSLSSGDFNGDGNLDLAVASSTSGYGGVNILLGDGKGGFGPAALFLVGNNPTSVVVGDFNRDKRHDLAVTNFTSRDVSVLLNQF